jgi:hypothetical protein
MAHIQFNHLSDNAFNSFVPEATKVASDKLFNKVLIVGGIALVLWLVFKPKESFNIKFNKKQLKKDNEL